MFICIGFPFISIRFYIAFLINFPFCQCFFSLYVYFTCLGAIKWNAQLVENNRKKNPEQKQKKVRKRLVSIKQANKSNKLDSIGVDRRRSKKN